MTPPSPWSPRRRLGATCLLLVMAMSAHAEAPVALPNGPGRAEVERTCSACHSLENILRTRRSRAQWSALIDLMIQRGARVSDEDIDVIADYLAQHFGS